MSEGRSASCRARLLFGRVGLCKPMRRLLWIAAAGLVVGGCDGPVPRESPAPGPCEELRLRRPADEPACIELAHAAALAQVGRRDEALAVAASVEAEAGDRPGVLALAALLRARWETDSKERDGAHARAYESALAAEETSLAIVVAADAVMAAGDVEQEEAQVWVERMEASIEAPPRDPGVAGAVASARGRVATEQERLDEALAYFEEALANQRERWGPRSPQVARGLANLGRAQRRAGKIEEAFFSYEQAIELRASQPWVDPSSLANAYEHRATLRSAQQQTDAALEDFRRVLKLRREALGPEHPDVAQTELNIAVTLHRAKRYAEARGLFDRALAGFSATLGAEHPMVAAVLINRGATLAASGLLDEATDDYLVALTILEAGKRQGSSAHVAVLVNLAAARMRQKRFDNAIDELAHALTLLERAGQAESKNAATLHVNACEAHRALGELEAARPRCERALEIREARLGADHPDTQKARDSLAKLEAGAPP